MVKYSKSSHKYHNTVHVWVPYLRYAGAGIWVAGGVVAKSWKTGQNEVDGADLQCHTAQQHAIVRGQRGAAEQCSQDVEWQRG